MVLSAFGPVMAFPAKTSMVLLFALKLLWAPAVSARQPQRV